jgi:membrane associated rhomboid family serine protease
MTPWVTRLLIANIAMFVVTYAAPSSKELFMFVPAWILLRPWTLVSYMFIHGDVMHILFNMLGLYFFGPRLEEEMGSKHFVILYFVSGLAGAVFSFLTPYVAIIGASGAVYGVLLGFAYFWPREQIYLWGVLPVQARWMVAGMTVLSLWGGFGASSDGVAHFAHLGGFAGGYIYVKWYSRRGWKIRLPAMPVLKGASDADQARWAKIDPSALHPVNREELLRIRQKMEAQGVGNLTAQERLFLDRFTPEH